MKRNSTSSPPGEEDSQSKKRRQLTEEETEVLKKEFEAHRDGKVPPPRKRELANELGLSEAQVFNWFNNHRQRHKTPNTPTLSIASSSSASSIRNTDDESESEVSPSEQQNHFSNGGKDGHLQMSSSQSSPSDKDPFVINLMAENERLRNELTELRERLQEMNGVGNGEDDQHNGNHNHRRRSKTSHNHSKRGEEIEDEDHEAISAAVSCVASLFDKVPSLRKFAPQPYYALSSNGSNHNNSNRVNKSRA